MDTLRVQYDESQDAEPVEFLIEQVAEFTSQDPMELSPLIGQVEPNALTSLLTDYRSSDSESIEWMLEFCWGDVVVTVQATGEIVFRRPEPEDDFGVQQLLKRSGVNPSLS